MSSNDHHDADDDVRDDAPALPEPDVLAAWDVPAPAPDLTDRVLAHVEAALPLDGGTVTSRPTTPRRRILAPVVVGVAMVAAAALVLGIAQTWRRPAAESAESSEVSPVAAPLDAASTLARGEPERAREPRPLPRPASPAEPEAPVPATGDLAPTPAAAPAPAAAPEAGAKPKGKGKPKPKPAEPDDAAKTAMLRIGTVKGETWAIVFIDGVRVGATPIMNAKVTPGRHTIRWEWEDGRSSTEVVELADGEVRTVKGRSSAPPPTPAP